MVFFFFNTICIFLFCCLTNMDPALDSKSSVKKGLWYMTVILIWLVYAMLASSLESSSYLFGKMTEAID